jgi:peptidoglycan/xylan/chitin deacetylase (PgdA/CDA1 family)
MLASSLKRLFYRGARLSGPNATMLKSNWRTHSLLMLCYHGVSLDDEDQWSRLYLSAELFRQRLEMLKQADCKVLTLGEGVEKLYQGTLPPRSVVITFDDGFYDFYAKAWPLLRQYGYPATVYLTTYYSKYNVPVFDPMCWYLLWKGCGKQFAWPEVGIDRLVIEDSNCEALSGVIKDYCLREGLSGRQKNALLRELAGRLAMDYDKMCARRTLHIMNPREVSQLAKEGVDFQLHCHRHRVYRSREKFHRELRDNQDAIQEMTGQTARHFCYPGGCRLTEFDEWLAEFGIASATTTDLALATRDCGRYTLPRLLDSSLIDKDEFSAWLSGLAHFVPRQATPPAAGQLVEEPGYTVAA